MLRKEYGHSNTSMVGEKRLYRSRAYYWRKCKTERGTTNIDSLPDELLLEILARLPADDLHDKARGVCRRWRHLIDSDYFIKTQLHRCTYGLLVCRWNSSDHPVFMTATQGRIETSEISYKFPNYFNLESSCNGLTLHCDCGKPLTIMNHVTRQKRVLPSFSYGKMSDNEKCCIGYAAASMEYKVVIPYTKPPDQTCLGILSVGRDKSWRHVAVEHLSESARNHISGFPLITEGFIIWPDCYRGSYLTLDVETEILTPHPSPLPEACIVRTYSFYLPTGRSLSLLAVDKYTHYLMGLWEMKAENGEWRKVVGDIKLGAHERWLEPFSDGGRYFLKPLGWVRYPEVLALNFLFSCDCIFFNLNTQEISSMDLPISGYHTSHAHKKSLAWFT